MIGNRNGSACMCSCGVVSFIEGVWVGAFLSKMFPSHYRMLILTPTSLQNINLLSYTYSLLGGLYVYVQKGGLNRGMCVIFDGNIER